MCYKESKECWGSEFATVIDGQVVDACQAHQEEGKTRTPVLRIEIIDIDDYDELDRFLTPFIDEEIHDVPGSMIYGAGSPFSDLVSDIYAWKYDMIKCDHEPEPTHLFIAWDFEDQDTFDRLDMYLDRGVIIENVVP